MRDRTMLIKRKLRLINDKQYADAHAYYHKNLYDKFTELSNKYEQELKEVDRELERNSQIERTPLIIETENAIQTLQLYCKEHKKLGDCLDCKLRSYCHDYYIDSWDNIK